MYLFYIDESGNTGARLDTPEQPVHWLVAIGVTAEAVKEIEAGMLQLAIRFFQTDALRSGFEFKGSEIFSGRGRCYELTPEQRIELYAGLLALLGAHGAQLFLRGIDKLKLAERAKQRGTKPQHPHTRGFQYLVECIDEWLERQQRQAGLFEEAKRTYGLLIADEQREVDRTLVDSFAVWRMWDTAYGYKPRKIRWLIDTVHYVPSHDSRLIQMADCVAYLRARLERLWREKGLDRTRYSESDMAMERLWESCSNCVAFQRVWPMWP